VLIISQQPSNGRSVFVVGNGPSNDYMDWQDARELIRRYRSRRHQPAEGRCDLLLMNQRALEQRATYSVAIDHEPLLEYQEARLTDRSIVLSHPPAPENKESLRALRESPRYWQIPKLWGPLGSGPLAAWAMAALGYRRIYLYGMDGSMGPVTERKNMEQMQRWDTKLSHFLKFRRRSRYGREGDERRPQLWRIWPESCPWRTRPDPLSRVLTNTVSI